MVSQRVNEELTERAAQFGLILDDISLVCLIAILSLFNHFTEKLAIEQASVIVDRRRFEWFSHGFDV